MPNGNLKHFAHLHLIVFIWGFTAVIGKLISIDALPLVWYRMAMAMVLVFIYINVMRFFWRLPLKTVLGLLGTGAIIALHWVTFFKAIKVSNVSIALACMSVGALFAAFLEPLWYKRKLVGYEVLFGLMVVFGLGISEPNTPAGSGGTMSSRRSSGINPNLMSSCANSVAMISGPSI